MFVQKEEAFPPLPVPRCLPRFLRPLLRLCEGQLILPRARRLCEPSPNTATGNADTRLTFCFPSFHEASGSQAGDACQHLETLGAVTKEEWVPLASTQQKPGVLTHPEARGAAPSRELPPKSQMSVLPRLRTVGLPRFQS